MSLEQCNRCIYKTQKCHDFVISLRADLDIKIQCADFI